MKRLVCALAGALLAFPSTGLANGRFPAANQIVFHPSDPDRMLIRVTFGALLSQDGGKTASWLCEPLVGYGGVQDPAVAITSDGTLLFAAFEGLARSHDQGCSFSFVPESEKEFVVDVAVDKQNPSSAVAITSSGQGDLTFRVQVLETQDSGKNWAFVGAPIDPSILAETIDPAPSRPQRLYVSGFSSSIVDGKQLRQGALVVSDDRAQSWIRRDIDLAGDQSVFIAAVDPVNPDRVYLRTRGPEQDRLLLTTDAGQTFSTVASLPGAMLGFALSPDGTRVAIGGPVSGVWIADTSSFQFSKVSAVEAQCLAWNDRGLHVCASAFLDGFAVGISQDEGKSWAPFLPAYQGLTGPLEGCSTTPPPTTLCAQEWVQLRATLGLDNQAGNGGSSGSAGAAGSQGLAGNGTSGQSGAGAQGGQSGQGGTSSPAAGAGGQPEPLPKDASSCGCATVGAPAGLGGLGAALASLAAALRKGRRRSR
jgi:hypothetical protein